MSYIINKTDGSVLTEIVDGSIDQSATDLTLIGKNSSSYGEFINENFIHILENFANTSQPNYPITGQLWFDTSDGRLKVYDGSGFKVSGGTIVSTTVPTNFAAGDIWIDSSRQQLYFNDGVSTHLAGPIYTAQQGLTGFETGEIVDTNNISHTVVYLWVAQSLIGLFSKDSFTPASAIPEFTGNIEIGFNTSTYSSIKFHTTATMADALVDPADGSLRTARDFLSATEDSTTTGSITIQNAVPLQLGPNDNTAIAVSNSSFNINSNTRDQNFEIKLFNNAGLLPALHIDATSQFVGLYTDTPSATLDVNGDAIIQGNLTVNGTTTNINSISVVVEDKNIVLGDTASPTDVSAAGGGITLRGDTDKTLTYNNVGIQSSWTSSEHFNLPVGKSFMINGFDVLSEDTLGVGILSAPGLTSVGILSNLQVQNININGSTISSTATDSNVIIAPNGIGAVNVNGAKVINVATPLITDPGTNAANKAYVDTKVQTAALVVSLDVTGLTNPQVATDYLDKLHPPAEHQEGTVCRVVATSSGLVTLRVFTLVSGVWTFQGTL